MRRTASVGLHGSMIGTTILLGLALGAVPTSAQSVSLDWSATVLRNGSAQNYGAMVVIDAASDIYVTGHAPLADVILTAKYDQAGNQLWQAEFDNPLTRERAAWLTLDPSGNVIVGGYNVAGASANPVGFVLLKYDSNGNLLWSSVIANTRGLTVRVATDSAGNVFLLGRAWLTNGVGNTTDDFLTMKFSPTGTLLWSQAAGFDSFSADTPTSMVVDAAGNLVVTGGTVGFVLTVSYDPDGNLRWSRSEAAAGGANDIALGPAGEVYAVGGTSGPPPFLEQLFLVLKYDASGNLIWRRTYPGTYARRAGVDSQDNLVVTGYTGIYTDWMTYKLDAAGNLLWSQRYDRLTSNDEIPYALTIGPDDAIYITGQGGPSIPFTSFLATVTVRYSPSGAEDWFVADTAAVRGLGVARAPNDTIAVVGESPFIVFHYVQTGGPGGNLAPVAVASGTPQTGPEPLTVSFSSSGSYDPDGSIVSYLWNFGDLTTSTDPSPTHVYTIAVPYVATLTVTDDQGAEAVDTVFLTIQMGPPGNLTATAVSASEIDLGWIDNAEKEDGFTIERCTGTIAACDADPSGFVEAATVGVNATSYADTGLASGTSYAYRVRPYNAAGPSLYSNTAGATTPGMAPNDRRINSGGATYTDAGGKPFLGDRSFSPGDFGYVGGASFSTASPIEGTGDDPLYQSMRGGASFDYVFDGLPAGTYSITLFFTEPFATSAGRRKFDVKVEGSVVLDDYDIFAKAGGKLIARIETVNATVSDGQLQIDFDAVLGTNALVSAIAVLPGVAPPPAPDISVTPASLAFGNVAVNTTKDLTLSVSNVGSANLEVTTLTTTNPRYTIVSPPAPLTIAPGVAAVTVTVRFTPTTVGAEAGDLAITSNDPDESPLLVPLTGNGVAAGGAAFRVEVGGTTYTDVGGNAWAPDKAYDAGGYGAAGGLTTTTPGPIDGTSDDLLYETIRGASSFDYQFDNVGNGTHTVVFHFNEPFYTAANKRKLDVRVEGVLVLDDLDIFAAAGGRRKALTRTVATTVLDGQLTINFVGVVGQALVSGIEVLSP